MPKKHIAFLCIYYFIICIKPLDVAAHFYLKPTDKPFDYVHKIPNNTYHQYCKNIYSQNGEDGILEQLLKELCITNGTFCEFGASNGITSSNTYNLIKKEFSGVAIEIDIKRYEQCILNYKEYPQVQVYHGAVRNVRYKENNLDTWLNEAGLPYDFDILSIDIDCDDYYIWQNMKQFKPKIVIIETNPYRDPVYDELPGKYSQEYNIDLLREWHPSRIGVGCSFMSAIKLGLLKGYIPVAYTGNITFVRKDIVSSIKDFPIHVSDDPYDYLKLYSHLVLWNNKWQTNTGLILNVAIRDYYLTFKQKNIDIDWINTRMRQIFNNENVIF